MSSTAMLAIVFALGPILGSVVTALTLSAAMLSSQVSRQEREDGAA